MSGADAATTGGGGAGDGGALGRPEDGGGAVGGLLPLGAEPQKPPVLSPPEPSSDRVAYQMIKAISMIPSTIRSGTLVFDLPASAGTAGAFSDAAGAVPIALPASVVVATPSF